MLQLDVFCITDLHILLFWLWLWRRQLDIFPGHPDIILMKLLPSMVCIVKLNMCIVMMLKSTVQLFIPVGVLVVVV